MNKIKTVGPWRSIETERYWELVGASRHGRNLVMKTYRESEGETFEDALTGLKEIAGYYDASWIIACEDVALREIATCVERTRPIKFATYLLQGEKWSQAASQLTALLSFWTRPGSSALSSRLTSRGLVRRGTSSPSPDGNETRRPGDE